MHTPSGQGHIPAGITPACISFSIQTVDEALKENADNVHPYIIFVGTIASFSSAVAVCNKKVITFEIGNWVISAVLTLLAIHYTYELTYPPAVQQVLEFLQEKLLADPLPGKKTSTAYSNLFRVVNCLQQRLEEEEDDNPDNSIDFDETQPGFDF